MSKLSRHVPAVFLFACLACAPEALADTVAITSGRFTVPRSGPFSFNLNGSGLRIEGAGPTTGNNIGPALCRPCTDEVSLDSVAGGSDISGSLTYQGRTFGIGLIGEERAEVQLTFTAGDFLIPDEFRDAAGIRITSLFDFEGDFNTLDPLRVDMAGSGVASLLLRNPTCAGCNFFEFENVEYKFLAPGAPLPQPSIQAVPEPATIILLSTGLAGIGAAVRKRRRAGKGEES